MKALKKHKLNIFFAVLTAFILFFSTFQLFTNVQAKSVKIDLKRDDSYSRIYKQNNISIYYTNDAEYHYLYISAINGFNGDILLKSNNISYNLGLNLDTDTIKSVVGSGAIECKARRDTIGNHIVLNINSDSIDLHVYPDTSNDEKKDEKASEKVDYSEVSPATGYLISILICFIWIISNALRNVFKKKYIEAYRVYFDEHGNERISDELEVIGEFKNQFPNHELGCSDFEMRKGTKRFILHSDFPFSDYEEYFIVKNYFFIRYLLNALVDSKKLQKPKQVLLGYSRSAKVARFFLKVFNWNWYGAFLSPFIFALSLSFVFPTFPPIIAIGLGIGALVNTIMYYGVKSGKLEIKREKIEIDEEHYIMPLESPKEIIDRFQVSGFRTITRKTLDGAKESFEEPFQDEIVEGFEALFKMRISKQMRITEYKQIDYIERTRTPQQMKRLKRDYFDRNRWFAERIFSLKKRNESLKKELKAITLEKEYIEETQQKNLREHLEELSRMREQRGNTLLNVFKNQFGAEYVEQNLNSAVERAHRIVQEERDRAKADKMDNLIILMEKLIDTIGQKSDLKLENLKILLKEKAQLESDYGNGGK